MPFTVYKKTKCVAHGLECFTTLTAVSGTQCRVVKFSEAERDTKDFIADDMHRVIPRATPLEIRHEIDHLRCPMAASYFNPSFIYQEGRECVAPVSRNEFNKSGIHVFMTAAAAKRYHYGMPTKSAGEPLDGKFDRKSAEAAMRQIALARCDPPESEDERKKSSLDSIMYGKLEVEDPTQTSVLVAQSKDPAIQREHELAKKERARLAQKIAGGLHDDVEVQLRLTRDMTPRELHDLKMFRLRRAQEMDAKDLARPREPEDGERSAGEIDPPTPADLALCRAFDERLQLAAAKPIVHDFSIGAADASHIVDKLGFDVKAPVSADKPMRPEASVGFDGDLSLLLYRAPAPSSGSAPSAASSGGLGSSSTKSAMSSSSSTSSSSIAPSVLSAAAPIVSVAGSPIRARGRVDSEDWSDIADDVPEPVRASHRRGRNDDL